MHLCANVHDNWDCMSDEGQSASGAACTEQLNVSHRTHYSRNSTRMQDIISLVDLTCAASPVQQHEMCIVIHASIATVSAYIRSCIHCNKHVNTSKHEAAVKQQGKVEHIRRLFPQICSAACTLL